MDRTKTQLADRMGCDFAHTVLFEGSRDRVFDAISTIKGLRGWWTPITGGSAALGGQLRFEFKGLDECIIMRVDRVDRPRAVQWTCLMHTELTEWIGTTVTFDLDVLDAKTCELKFRHIGLNPTLLCYQDCRQGWQHFLTSLVTYVEHGKGMPFGR